MYKEWCPNCKLEKHRINTLLYIVFYMVRHKDRKMILEFEKGESENIVISFIVLKQIKGNVIV